MTDWTKVCKGCGKKFEASQRDRERPYVWANRKYCTQKCYRRTNGELWVRGVQESFK